MVLITFLLMAQTVIPAGPQGGIAVREPVDEQAMDDTRSISELHFPDRYPGETLHVGGSGPDNYTDIQTALMDAADGDIVLIHPGNYTENLLISSEIWLRGDGSGPLPRLLPPMPGSTGVKIDANNVTITALNLTDFSTAIDTPGSGHNISGNVFYGNLRDIEIEYVSSPLSIEHDLYGLEIRDNDFRHFHSSDTVRIYYHITFDGLSSHDFDAGDILISGNSFHSDSTIQQQLDHSLFVTGLQGGSMDIGEFRVEGNTFRGGGEDLRFESRLDRHSELTANIRGVRVIDNIFERFNGRGVRIDYYRMESIHGSSLIDAGDLYIAGNRFSSPIGGDAVFVNHWTGAVNLHDTASVTYGNMTFSGNRINVSGHGLFLEADDMAVDLLNYSTVKIGTIFVNNNTIERSSNGIYLYFVNLGEMYGSSRVRMGYSLVENNDITAISNGVYLQFESLGYAMQGASSAAIGDVIVRWNNVSSTGNGIGIHMSDAARDLRDWSSFRLGYVILEENTISTPSSNAIMVETVQNIGQYLRNLSKAGISGFVFIGNTVVGSRNGIIMDTVSQIGNELMDDSGFTFGGFNISRNVMDVAMAGLLVNTFSSMAEHMYGSSSAMIWGVMVNSNDITSDGYGIIVQMNDICRYMEDLSNASFSGIEINGNTVRSRNNGISVPGFDMLGTDLWDNSTAWVDPFSICNNSVESMAHGIFLSRVYTIGYLLRNWSVVHFGGVRVSGNDIASGLTGIHAGLLTYWGFTMFQDARVICGPISFDDNEVVSGGASIEIDEIGYFGFILFNRTKVVFEGFSFRYNDLRSNGSGCRIGSFGHLGYDTSDDSIFLMGDMIYSDNTIYSGDRGMFIDVLGYIGYYMRGRASVKAGNLTLSMNRIQSTNSSIEFGFLTGLSYVLEDHSSVEGGELRIRENQLRSEKASGVRFAEALNMGTSMNGNSTASIGGWYILNNEIRSGNTSVDLSGLGDNFRDNGPGAQVEFGGFHIEGNDLTSNASGMYFRSTSFGTGCTGETVLDLGSFSFTDNMVGSHEGVTIFIEGIVLEDSTSLFMGPMDISGNVIGPSLGNGLNLTLQVETYQMASFVSGPVNIVGNIFESAGGSILILRTLRTRVGSSRLNPGRFILRENNITGGAIGLEMHGVEGARVYTNNFASNMDQLKLVDSSAFWTSNSMIWYRHGMKNLTNYLGNFWDFYSGPDNNDDGIGDTRYNTGNGFDTAPLVGFFQEYLPPWDDTTPPFVRILSPETGEYLNSPSLEITWEGTDELLGIDHFEASLDGGEWLDVGFSGKIQYYDLQEGPHTFTVRAFDVAGNSNASSVTFTIDMTYPSLDILFPSDGAYVNTTDVMVLWEGFDDLSGISGYGVKMDNGSWIDAGFAVSRLFTNLTEGRHYVEIRTADRAGNEMTARSDLWIDLTPPEISIYHPADGMVLVSTSLHAEWSALDELSGINASRVRIDTAPWIHKGREFSHLFLNLSSGHHTLQVSCRDGAGNWMVESVDLLIERGDGSVNITHPPEGVRLGASTVEVRWEILGTVYPLSMVQSRLDGGAWENLSVSYSRLFIGLVDGVHIVDIRIVDMGGNTDIASVTFTVDLMKPLIIFQSHQGNNAPPGDRLFITFSEPMDGDSFEITLSADNEETPFNWTLEADAVNLTFDISLEGGTRYDLGIKGADLAGNVLVETLLFWTATGGTIAGRVVYRDGDPLIGGRVMLDSGTDVYTLENGAFQIEAPAGRRTITVYDQDGHLLGSFEIDVVAGKVSRFDEDIVVERYSDDDASPWWLWILIAAVILILLVGGIIFLYTRTEKEMEIEDEEGWDEDYDDDEYDEWDEDDLEF